jgi:glycosyltransferase involved in cell wall biosynthesis
MSRVIVYTPAYNAEKTLHRTVDSVLAQTYTDFVYYLLDNAATDNTHEIVKEYAEKDKRIVPLYNEINWRGNWISDVIKNHNDDCYFCELDADDEYAPDFLEKMLAFIDKEHLDIAACGSYFLDAQKLKYYPPRKINQNLILEGNAFNNYLSQYYQFMRTIWGKVYSLSVIRRPFYKNYKVTRYGSDTLFTIGAFYNANRIGILAEPLHKYYIFPQTVSSQFNENRITSDRVLLDATRDFLISKCGTINHENLNFLFMVYFFAIRDTINTLFSAQMTVTDKLCRLRDIFQSQQTQELFQRTDLEENRNEMSGQVAVWVLSQKEARSGTDLETAADILAAMGVYPSEISNWQQFQVFMLLTKMKDKLTKMGFPHRVDAQIVSSASKSTFLAGLSAEFLTFFREIASSILQNDEKKALSQIEDTIAQRADIPSEYIEAFLTLGLNLSAKLKHTNDFIYIKKLQISLFIDLSRIDEAQEALADWDKILPDDIDFKKLRMRLTQ